MIIHTSEGGDWYASNKNSESFKAAFNQFGDNIELISEKMFQDGKTSQNIMGLNRGSEVAQQIGSVFQTSVHFNSEENSASREKTQSPDQENSRHQSREY